MKNIFKRLCCLFISIVLFSGTLAVAQNTENQSQLSESMNTAMYFLRELGIIGDYFEHNTDISEKITRAEFADVTVKALNIKNVGGKDTYFYDVPVSHFAYGAINTLAEMGFVDGVGNNCFDPDSYIQTASACKIILSVLGYDKLASLNNKYVNGYIDMATKLELINNTPNDSVLTRGEMFILIFEALKTPMYTISGADGANAVFEADEDETILKVYHHAMFDKGVVDGVRTDSFNDVKLMENEVDISGKVYTSRVDLDDMLGEEVEFIAYMDDDWESGEVAVAMQTGKTKVMYISEKDFEKFDKNEYKLFYSDENGKRKSVRIERDVKLIYNGGLIEKNISDRLNEGCKLKLISDKDGYDRIVAKKKQSMVVKNVDLTGEIIVNMADSPRALILKDCESVFIKKNGEAEMSLEKLVQGDVLSVYKSYTQSQDETSEYIEIIVGSDKVSGIIETINDTDKKWMTVNGVEYLDLSGVSYKAGDNVELYLDVDGDVAYVKLVSLNDFAAYLIEGKAISDYPTYGKDIVLRIEMFKQDGNIAKLVCNENVNIDGNRTKDVDEALSYLMDFSTRSFKPQLALIKTNDEGLITSIDTADGDDEEGTLQASFEKESVMYRNVGYFGSDSAGTVAVGNSTVFFRVPTQEMIEKGETTEEDYGIGINGYIEDFDWVTASSYRTTKRKAGYEQYVVVERGGKGSSVPWPILVEKVVSVYDAEEGESFDAIVGYDGYKNVTVVIKDNATWLKKGSSWQDGNKNSIERGMVVTFVKNTRGHATEVNLIYDPSDAEYYYSSGDYIGRMNEIGIAEDAADKVLTMKIGKEGRTVAVKSDDAEIMVCDGGVEIRKGTFLDAKLYSDSYDQSNPTTYSDVVVFQWDRRPLRVYIFK